MKILFIEDQEELNAIGSIQLEDLGHTVYPAFSVWEARDIYAKHKDELDLIIADHRLPDGLGIAFLEVLREAACTIPSAVVSGCLTLDEQEDLERQGIPYFLKPVLYGEVLEQLLAGRHGREQRAAATADPRGFSESGGYRGDGEGLLAGVTGRNGFFSRLFRAVS